MKADKKSNRYRDILENMTEGYFEVDDTGRFAFLNGPMAAMLGYGVEELLGADVKAYLSEENVQALSRMLKEQAQGSAAPLQLNERYVRKDGEVVYIEASVGLMSGENGDPAGFSGIAHDVTERKKMEQQIIQMHKMEAIGTLAGGIAHEFNNLLMGIQGYTFLMLRELLPDHPHHQKLVRIEELVRDGAELTSQLLGFAREGQYEVRTVNLAEMLEETSVIFGQSKEGLTIKRQIEKNLWTVEADQGQIEQVLQGLYLNAWKAMPSGGILTLEALNVLLDGHDGHPFKILPGAYVKVSVQDTGIGMDEKTQARIFEPFFTTKEMGHGAGLGLASAYGIIKGHGGFIDVISQKGEGATFSIYLPASQKKATSLLEASGATTPGKGTILLIDDEAVIIDICREILEMLGYAVVAARTGQEGIDLYKSRQSEINLVILDMIMPGMGGGETFDHLKGINPLVRVLLSTGYSLTGQAKEIMARGCLGFIQKPFRIETLSQKIHEVLEAPLTRGK